MSGQQVGTPRWAWWALVLVLVLFTVGAVMLAKGRPTAAIVCGIFGLVIGCATHLILTYLDGRAPR